MAAGGDERKYFGRRGSGHIARIRPGKTGLRRCRPGPIICCNCTGGTGPSA
jgi:hypothetical protein